MEARADDPLPLALRDDVGDDARARGRRDVGRRLGPVNIIIESSQPPSTVEEMIRSTERGLLVSRFWYIRSTDPRTASLTGLTRDGVWYIEDGEIRYPVKNFRFNQSIIAMLAPGNVEMIGASERVGDRDGGSLLPALKLKAFNFTSQSEAV